MTTIPSLAGAIPSLDGPLASSAATNYYDIKRLADLKRDPGSPQSITAVAQQVEALFLQMMLKSMRDANIGDETASNEMGMYQDMFDKQVALTISRHQDLGISTLLQRQVSDKTAPASRKSASGEPTASATVVAQTPADFVSQVMPTIRRAAAELGVNPLGLLAQAALETGWGQRMARTADGSPSFNMFGVKAGEGWSGGRATADTVEINNGVASQRRTAFRAYGSIEDSVTDFATLLKSSPRYRDVIAAGGDTRAYIASIGKSGYATDPQYANKLNQILTSDTLRDALAPRTATL